MICVRIQGRRTDAILTLITHWRPWLIICDCRHLDLERGLSKIQLSLSSSSVGFKVFSGRKRPNTHRKEMNGDSREFDGISAHFFSRSCGCFTLPAFRVLICRWHAVAKILSSPWNLNNLHYFWRDLRILIPSQLVAYSNFDLFRGYGLARPTRSFAMLHKK